eukprot:CAMPEP_0198135106 /NCGR_PEP_ID=MMETSP1442-20131203/60419_1 /TAXON_ID= /ORGANISM="Craspedostauros australis, Strain CCMP3328" /LENGTH=155 /DNA_ID=CAMNT_0043796267 /DNA_START=114 /DNA_END=581 /DNA_ORIENTATION=+
MTKRNTSYEASQPPIVVPLSTIAVDGNQSTSANVPTAPPTPSVQGYATHSHNVPADDSTFSAYNDTEATKIDGRTPMFLIRCPTCNRENVRTLTRTYPNAATWVFVGISAIVFTPLFWVPLVMDSMKQTDHFCQSCGGKVGTVKPMEDCCVKEMH